MENSTNRKVATNLVSVPPQSPTRVHQYTRTTDTRLLLSRFIVLGAIIMLFFSSLNTVSAEDPPASFVCCHFFYIDVQETDSCCIEITFHNPDCMSGLTITFDQDEGDGNGFQTKQSINIGTGGGNYATATLCAVPGQGSIEYRIRASVLGSPGNPACVQHNPYEYHEGFTQFTGSYAVDCCPCPQNVNDWLKVTMVPDPSCPHSCMVNYEFEIPEGVTCYKYFAIYSEEYPEGQMGDVNNPTSINHCIEPNVPFQINIFLLAENIDDENYHHTKGCWISDVVECQPPDSTIAYEPCIPDCEDDEWKTPYESDIYQLVLCDSCLVQITYTHRIACKDTWAYQDIQIVEIKLLNSNCNSCSQEALYHQALGAIIAHNKMGFQPQSPGQDPDSCNTQWRVTTGSCMAFWTMYIWDDTHLDSIQVWRPCNESDCCAQRITVCRHTDESVTFSIDTANVVLYDCVNLTIPHPFTGTLLPCNPICDWLASLTGHYPYPIVITADPPGGTHKGINDDGVEKSNKLVYEVRTEVSQEMLNIWVISEHTGTAKVEIIDVMGNTVVSAEQQITQGLNQIQLDISQFSSGIYIYALEIDGLSLKSDKFVIVK